MKSHKIAALALIALTSITATGDAFAQRAGVPGGAPNNPPRTHIPENEPEPVVQESEVCFYTGKLYKGGSFCTEQKGYFELSPYWKNRIRSITISQAVVKACTTTDLKGACQTYSGNVDQLAAELINGIKVVTIQ